MTKFKMSREKVNMDFYFILWELHYGERSINLNKVVATFENHTFLSQTELTRTGIISICICIKYVDGSTSGLKPLLL
jgi:hypothetical protein